MKEPTRKEQITYYTEEARTLARMEQELRARREKVEETLNKLLDEEALERASQSRYTGKALLDHTEQIRKQVYDACSGIKVYDLSQLKKKRGYNYGKLGIIDTNIYF